MIQVISTPQFGLGDALVEVEREAEHVALVVFDDELAARVPDEVPAPEAVVPPARTSLRREPAAEQERTHRLADRDLVEPAGRRVDAVEGRRIDARPQLPGDRGRA